MWQQAGRLALLLVVIWFGLGAATRSQADLIINTPAGLNPGDQFRIVFVTDAARIATSTAIGDYNTFVSNDAQTEAGGGNVTYNGTTLTWAAIASTSSVNAITNIGTYGVPVYLSNGTLVAATDTNAGLWSGSLSQAISTDLHGTNVPTTIWTGSVTDGTGAGKYALGGSSGNSVLGDSRLAAAGWIQSTLISSRNPHPFYGISQPLGAQADPIATPEPSTLSVAATGIITAIGYVRCRRRWTLRGQGPEGQRDASE